MRLPHRISSSARNEGFTVIEVMVAVLMLAIITSGVALAVAGGAKLEGSARTSAALADKGQLIYEQFVGDRAWMDTCGATCPLSDLVDEKYQGDEDLGVEKFNIVVTGERYTPTAADNQGASEVMYKLSVYVALNDQDAARLGNPKPFSVNGILTRSGENPEGSVTIEVCRAVNQADERMSIAGCSVDGTAIAMGPCPSGTNPATKTSFSCPELARVSNPSFASLYPLSDTNPSKYVKVQRLVDLEPKLKNGAEIVTGTKTDDPGVWSFPRMRAAEWTIDIPDTLTSPAPLERWRSHENPSSGRVTIEPSRRAKALVMYRPTKTGTLFVKLDRRVKDFKIGTIRHERTTPIKNEPTESFEGNIEDAIPETDYDVARAPKNEGEGFIDIATSTGRWVRAQKGVPMKNCVTRAVKTWKQNWFSIAGGPWKRSGSRYAVEDNTSSFWCSWYTVHLDWDFYAPGMTNDKRVKDGAADKVQFTTEPRPNYRHLWLDEKGVVKNVIPQSVPAVPAGKAARAVKSVKIEGIPAGLNSKVMTTGNSLAWKHKDLNGQIDPHMTWVNPVTGGVRGPTGTPISNLHVTGQGECYWWGPGYSEKEGACSPCAPYWNGRGTMPESCTLVMKMKWQKVVNFTFKFSTSSIYDTSTVDGDWPMGETPWGCKGYLTGCRPPSQVTIQSTTHTLTGGGASGTATTPPNPSSQLGAFEM